MLRILTAHSTHDSLKKQAKRRLKAVRARDTQARARLQQLHPRASADPGLREVQHALALEHGAVSWIALKQQLDDLALAHRTQAERLEEFLEHAILNYGIPPGTPRWNPEYPDDPARRVRAARILARHPEITRQSIHAAVIAGDVAAVESLLQQDPRSASAKAGPRDWEPLLYLAYARLPTREAADNAVPIATRLLDHGASPHVQMSDGENPFTALTGFIGEGERTLQQVPPHPHAAALVTLLIERGANPFDTQALYNTSLWHDSTQWLELLHGCDAAAGMAARWKQSNNGRPGQLDYLLGNAVARNHVRRVAWLLDHGANPRTKSIYSRRNLHTEAVLHGHTALGNLLAAAGAQVEPLAGREAFQAASLRLDVQLTRTLARQHPECLTDPTTLLVAARRGQTRVVELLLDLGTSADAANTAGERPLHVVVWSDSVPTAQLLIARGAQIDARDHRYGATPLGWAIHLGKPQLIEYLAPLSRDVLSLTLLGKLERLRELLQAEPLLARAGHNAVAPLFCLPEQDEALAIDVATLLLQHGADPKVRDAKGTTPDDAAERLGMEALAEVLRDAGN